MSQDWDVEPEEAEYDPRIYRPIPGDPLRVVASMGLVLVSMSSGVASVMAMVLGGAVVVGGALMLGPSNPYMAVPAIILIVLLLAQILPMISSAAGIYTAIGLNRGGHPAALRFGSLVSVVGPVAHTLTAMALFVGVVGVALSMLMVALGIFGSLVAVACCVLANLAINRAMNPPTADVTPSNQ